MDLGDTGQATAMRFLIRDRDAKYPALIKETLSHTGITTALTGVRMLRAELLDRTLIWNETHLRHPLHPYERHYNQHRTHRALAAAAPLQELPHPLETDRIERLTIRRHDSLGGVIHECRNAS
jgi:hypothetical protein